MALREDIDFRGKYKTADLSAVQDAIAIDGPALEQGLQQAAASVGTAAPAEAPVATEEAPPPPAPVAEEPRPELDEEAQKEAEKKRLRQEAARELAKAELERAEAERPNKKRYKRGDKGPDVFEPPAELLKSYKEQLSSLDNADMGRLYEVLIHEETVPADLAAKVPALVKLQDLEEARRQGPGFFKGLGHFVGGGVAGVAEGLANVSDASLALLNWVDNNVGFDNLDDGQVTAARELIQERADLVADNWIPDSWCGSLGSAIGKNAVGLVAGGAAMKGVGAAASLGGAIPLAAQSSRVVRTAHALTKSAIASSTAFSIKEDTVLDSLNQVPGLDYLIYDGLVSSPDDTEAEKRLKMVLGSVVTDTAFGLISRGVKKLGRLFRVEMPDTSIPPSAKLTETPPASPAPPSNPGVSPKARADAMVYGDAAASRAKANAEAAAQRVAKGKTDLIAYNDAAQKADAAQRAVKAKADDLVYNETAFRARETARLVEEAEKHDDVIANLRADGASQEEIEDTLRRYVRYMMGKSPDSAPSSDAKKMLARGRAAQSSRILPDSDAEKIVAGTLNAHGERAVKETLTASDEKLIKEGLKDIDRGLRKAAADGSEAAQAYVNAADDIDAHSFLAKARKIAHNMDSGGYLRQRGTRELTNSEPFADAFLNDNGVDAILHVGDDADNLLGRLERHYVTQHKDEMVREAVQFAKDLGVQVTDELEVMAQMSDDLVAGFITTKGLMIDGARTLGGLVAKLNDPALDASAREGIINGELTHALRGWARIANIYDAISTNGARLLRAHQFNDIFSDSGPFAAPAAKASAVNGIVAGADIPAKAAQSVTNARYEKLLNMLSGLSGDQKIALARRIASEDSVFKGARYMKMLGDSAGNKALNMMTELFMNDILSGPVTHMVNFTSNMLKALVVNPADNLMQAAVYGNREAFMRGWHAYGDLFHTLHDSWQMAVKAFKQGQNVLKLDHSVIEGQFRYISSLYSGVDSRSTLGRFIDGFGACVNIPSRFLMASDELSSQLAFRMSIMGRLRAQAERLFKEGAASQGESIGAFTARYLKENFDSYFTGRGTVNRLAHGAADALQDAMTSTWTQPLVKGSLGESVSRMVNNHPALRFIIPFVRTPMNILDDAMMHFPGLNVLSRNFWNAMKEGGAAREAAMAKLYTGSIFTGLVAGGYLMGSVTGSGPRDRAARETLLASGWRPYSVRVGDTYISYARLEPLSTIIGCIADAGEILAAANNGDIDETDAGQAAAAAIFGVAGNFVNKTYMKGLSDFMEAVTSDKPDKAQRILTNLAQSMVPGSNLLAQSRKVIDPQMREVRSTLDRIRDRIPGLSSTLPAKYSWLTGEPVRYYGGMASGLSPVVWETTQGNETYEVLARLGDKLSAPSDRISGYKLTAEQASFFNREEGTLTIGGLTQTQALAKAIADYNRERGSSPPDDAELAVKCNNVIAVYRRQARVNTIRKFPELKGNTPRLPSAPTPNVNRTRTSANLRRKGGPTVAEQLANFK